MNRMRANVLLLQNQGASDTTAPTVTITCSQTSPTATTPLNCTATFSEEVSGFVVGDITVGNGTAGNFATADNIVFTFDVTPTATGAVIVDIAAGVCTDGTNENEAATQFSIVAIVYTLNDLFTTADAAPVTSPRTCEPGPGTITFTDTGNRLSIASDNLLLTKSAGATWADPAGWGAGIVRAAGLAFLARWKTSLATNGMFGFDGNTAGTIDESCLHLDQSGNLLQARSGGASCVVIPTYLTNTEYSLEIILRATGYFLIHNDELQWVDASRTTATVYPSLMGGDHTTGGPVLTFPSVRVAQLPAPWDTDNGIATQVLSGSRTAGDAFVHEGNCLIEFYVQTLPSAGQQIEVRFRIQDANNYWQATIDNSGAMDIDEVVAGTPTQRATKAGGGGALKRYLIACKDATIRFTETSAGVNTCVYASATNFATETDGLLQTEGGGDVRTIISWPMTLSGAARAAIDAANP